MHKLRMIVAVAIATGAAAIAAPASAQDVRRGPNNTWEVHFSGPCLVAYDNNGGRIFTNPACSRWQVQSADMTIRSRMAGPTPGYPGQPGYGNGWNREPIVTVNRGGAGSVNFRNGCVVTFNRDGRRIGDTRRCDGAMRAQAQALYQQRLWGGGGYPGNGYPGNGYGYGNPWVDMLGVYIRVQMRGTNCTYLYTRGGNHVSSSGSQCNSRLRDVANDAARNYRRQMGW